MRQLSHLRKLALIRPPQRILLITQRIPHTTLSRPPTIKFASVGYTQCLRCHGGFAFFLFLVVFFFVVASLLLPTLIVQEFVFLGHGRG